MSSIGAIEAKVWAHLIRSFPDLKGRDLTVVGGSYEGRDYVPIAGHSCGTFRENWLTIPATGRPLYIRQGEVHQIRNGRIIQSNCLWDILDVCRQAGFCPLAHFDLHHEGLIRENWVSLYILDLLRQMGVDVIARMQRHFRRGT